MPIKKIAILFSGRGSNLENLIKKLHDKSFDGFIVKVVLAITNNPNAQGIQKAKKYGINTTIIDHLKFNSREEFDKELVNIIKSYHVELTVLAGFMRILTPTFTKVINAINIHPSLLPHFKGANAMQRSFNSTMKKAGVSVHFVNDKVDEGEVVMQQSFNKTGLDFEEFSKTITQIEHELFPKAVLRVL